MVSAWEYLTIYVNLEHELNTYGANGWELVHVTSQFEFVAGKRVNRAVFKRPVVPGWTRA